ncbi:MAG TPA: class I SAM-dependent methyltransferase [Bryobacteraceae bacterium]|jgi:SAM-dependent methyltransferase
MALKARPLTLAPALLALVMGLWPASAFQQPSIHPLTGRHIAGVCGAGPCATWLERPEREQEEKPEAALDALNLKPGMVVADVGAGSGYMSVKLARRVGPAGRVYAEDVQPEMLEKVRANSARAGLKNIQTVQGTFTDPKLPALQMDLVLLVDVYHEFSEPQKMLHGIRDSLKADGRLVLLEYRGEDPSIPILPEHKMTVAQVKTELEAEGFRLGPVIETLPRQHILILTKAAAAKAAGR